MSDLHTEITLTITSKNMMQVQTELTAFLNIQFTILIVSWRFRLSVSTLWTFLAGVLQLSSVKHSQEKGGAITFPLEISLNSISLQSS